MIEIETIVDFLDLSDGESDHPALLAIEAGAVAFIEAETGQTFAQGEVTKYLDGLGTDTLYLPTTPNTVTSISVRPSWSAGWDTLVEPAEVFIDGRALIITTGETFPVGTRNIRVIYDTGSVAGSEPADIRLAVLELIGATWRNRVVAVPIDPGLQVGFPSVPTSVRETIKRYRGVAF